MFVLANNEDIPFIIFRIDATFIARRIVCMSNLHIEL